MRRAFSPFDIVSLSALPHGIHPLSGYSAACSSCCRAGRRAGVTLRRALGYLIDDTRPKTESRLKQYAQFHRYYPYVMRAVP
jgi:hypothetical protein